EAERRRRARYDLGAATTAFFSMLEHLLVFALATVDYDPATVDIGGFVKKRWAEKFKRVLDLSDSETKKHYDSLHAIATQIRNPQAHGGFGAETSRFYVHLTGIGAVPLDLSKADPSGGWASPFMPLHEDDELWSAFDDLLRWFASGPLRFAWRYAEAGIGMPFDAESRQRLRQAMMDDETFATYLDHLTWGHDQAANMDW
ncbi:MAG TPA: hypothetical protein VGC03_03590, partial [Acidimicrobiia bacterium]